MRFFKTIFKVIKCLVIIFTVLFSLSIVVYFFNLDMKLAAAMIPVMNKIYDRGKDRRLKRAGKAAGKSDGTGTESRGIDGTESV